MEAQEDCCVTNECSICLSDVKNHEISHYTCKFNHLFHKKCINRWAVSNERCPMCRQYMEYQKNNTERKNLLLLYSFPFLFKLLKGLLKQTQILKTMLKKEKEKPGGKIEVLNILIEYKTNFDSVLKNVKIFIKAKFGEKNNNKIISNQRLRKITSNIQNFRRFLIDNEIIYN